MAVVQDAENPVEAVTFLYTGMNTDIVYLTNTLQEEAQKRFQRRLKIGGKASKVRSLKQDEDYNKQRNWLLDPTMPVRFDADKTDAEDLKRLVLLCFHKKRDRMHLPGMIYARPLPAVQMMTGSDSELKHTHSLWKHRAVYESLDCQKTTSIKKLDSPAVSASSETKITLRRAIMLETFPLVLKEEETHKPLYHSVDYIRAGYNQGSHVLTFYNDRRTTAKAVLNILPAYMAYKHGKEAAEKWFHAVALKDIADVRFNHTLEGEFDRLWTTPDDAVLEGIMEEDMGIDLQIEGLSIVNTSIMILTGEQVDCGSLYSFTSGLDDDIS